jgi:hypothetical protein
MPYFCHTHNGLYEPGENAEDGCQNDGCVGLRAKDMSHVKLSFPDVPGGFSEQHRSADYKFRKDFGPGIDAYKKARADGLQPRGTTTKKVKEAYREVQTQQRAIKKLKRVGEDVSQWKVAPGVEK